MFPSTTFATVVTIYCSLPTTKGSHDRANKDISTTMAQKERQANQRNHGYVTISARTSHEVNRAL